MDMQRATKILLYFALILLAVVCLIPFAMMLVNATRSNEQIVQGFTLIPGSSLSENYQNMMYHMDVQDGIFKGIWVGFKNSLIVAVCVTFLTGYFSALTAYGFHAYNFRGKNVLFVIILVTMMVPTQLGLLGFYELNKGLKLLNTFVPLIVPAVASPFTVFFMRQYLRSTLHPAVIDAARIDGASEIRIFHSIVIPLMMPAIATMSIFAFIASWNNYLYPLIVLYSPEKYTLPVLMGYLKGGKVAENLGSIYLAISISVVPIMVAFLALSKRIIGSISAGSVKG